MNDKRRMDDGDAAQTLRTREEKKNIHQRRPGISDEDKKGIHGCNITRDNCCKRRWLDLRLILHNFFESKKMLKKHTRQDEQALHTVCLDHKCVFTLEFSECIPTGRWCSKKLKTSKHRFPMLEVGVEGWDSHICVRTK